MVMKRTAEETDGCGSSSCRTMRQGFLTDVYTDRSFRQSVSDGLPIVNIGLPVVNLHVTLQSLRCASRNRGPVASGANMWVFGFVVWCALLTETIAVTWAPWWLIGPLWRRNWQCNWTMKLRWAVCIIHLRKTGGDAGQSPPEERQLANLHGEGVDKDDATPKNPQICATSRDWCWVTPTGVRETWRQSGYWIYPDCLAYELTLMTVEWTPLNNVPSLNQLSAWVRWTTFELQNVVNVSKICIVNTMVYILNGIRSEYVIDVFCHSVYYRN